MEASLGEPLTIPEHSMSEDKWSEALKPSRLLPPPTVSGFTVIFTTLCKLAF